MAIELRQHKFSAYDMNGAVALLRARTRDAHETVDAVFGTHLLADRDDYRRFLIAHARALPAAEALAAQAMPLRARTPLLADDLARLDTAMPDVLTVDASGAAAAWGALYVVEGSRLGGRLLAQSVPATLPCAYLGATHLPGEWRAIREAIDAAAAPHDAAWHETLVAGARATFDLYRRAAITN